MTTRFEQALGQHLVSGESERFALPSDALEQLGQVLADAVAGARGRQEVKRALQLIIALRTTLESPTASARVADLLRSAPDAMPHLQALGASADRSEEARRFLEQDGRAAPLVAPTVEELAGFQRAADQRSSQPRRDASAHGPRTGCRAPRAGANADERTEPPEGSARTARRQRLTARPVERSHGRVAETREAVI